MKTFYLEAFIALVSAALIGRTIIPVLVKKSKRLGLIDRPNSRKTHSNPTPLIGGIAIVFSVSIAVLLSPSIQNFLLEHSISMAAALSIFIIGVWDDRSDLSPKLRLFIQLAAATAICISGIRIESLHGFMGIEEIPTLAQYVLTVLVITGVSNAFNLMDGVDALAGSLALMNMMVLAVLFFYLNLQGEALLAVAFIGGLIPFLRANRYPAQIFMGDGGSMMIGFTTAVAGIHFIQQNQALALVPGEYAVLLSASILIVPVVDALRVFLGRYVRGYSILTPDRSHLHHLFLDMGTKPIATTLAILFIEVLVIASAILLAEFYSITVILLALPIAFLLLSKVLRFNGQLMHWQKKIKDLEAPN